MRKHIKGRLQKYVYMVTHHFGCRFTSLLVLRLETQRRLPSICLRHSNHYILFILDGLWLYPLAWMRTPLLAYFKVIASILVICFLEYLVVQRFKNQLSKLDIWLGVILLLALIILGLATAQWGPWVNL